jgi:hypothetical protein
MVLQLPLMLFNVLRVAPFAGRLGWRVVAAQLALWVLAAMAAKVLT